MKRTLPYSTLVLALGCSSAPPPTPTPTAAASATPSARAEPRTPPARELVAEGEGLEVIVDADTRHVLAVRSGGNASEERAELSDHPFDTTHATLAAVEGTDLVQVTLTNTTKGNRATAHYLVRTSSPLSVACVFGGTFEPGKADARAFRREVTVSRLTEATMPSFRVEVHDHNRPSPGEHERRVNRYDVPPHGTCTKTELPE